MNHKTVSFGDYFLLNMNLVIRFMILSNVVWYSAMGLLGPIFALFIVNFIEGGNAAVAGVAAAIYLISKSIFQIPAATIIDHIPGEKDDFWIMTIGQILAGCIPLLYLIINTPTQLYLVQFLYGLVIATTFPSYMAIFTRHIDRDSEGRTWGIFFTLNDLGMAITASTGGLIATIIGFQSLIVGVSFFAVLSGLLLIPIRSRMRMPQK